MNIGSIELGAPSKQTAYYRNIAKKREEVAIPHQLIPKYEQDGYKQIKRLKTKSIVSKDWDDSTALDNQIYCCLYELNVEYLCSHVRVALGDSPDDESSASVLASTEVAILVIDGKSYQSKKGNLTNADVDHLHSKCGLVRKRLDRSDRRKVIGLVVTENSTHGNPVDEYASAKGIVILRLEDINIYRSLAKGVGGHAKYMFYARLMTGKEIPDLELQVPAIYSKVAGRTAYTFVAQPEDLLQICYIAHRTGKPSVSYQRLMDKKKLAEIRSYIDKGGTFPTNIIVAFEEGLRGLRFEAGEKIGDDGKLRMGRLVIPGIYGCAWVVDGQHRLLGYAGHKWASTAYLHVTAYEGLPKQEQAQMFDDINSNQTKVAKNHLAELDAILHDESSDPILRARSLASQALQEMALDAKSTLGERLITSATSKRASRTVPVGDVLDRIQTRSSAASGLMIKKVASGKVTEYGPLWSQSTTKTKARLVRLLNTWFRELSSACPKRWSDGADGLVATQRGVAAMLRYLFWTIERERFDGWDSQEELEGYIGEQARALGYWWEHLDQARLQRINKYGSTGVPVIVAEASESLSSWPEIGGSDLKRTVEEHLMGDPDEVASKFRRAELACIKRLRKLLVDKYGNDDEALLRGLPAKELGDVTSRWAEEGGTYTRWAYLWFIDIKKAADQHWDLCQDSFEMFGRGKKEGLAWLVELNEEVRRAIAHGGGLRVRRKHGDKLDDVLAVMDSRSFDTSGRTESLLE